MPRFVKCDPQPVHHGADLWGYEGEIFVTRESLSSHLFHDVFGAGKANGVGEWDQAQPTLIEGIWYWEIDPPYRQEASNRP